MHIFLVLCQMLHYVWTNIVKCRNDTFLPYGCIISHIPCFYYYVPLCTKV